MVIITPQSNISYSQPVFSQKQVSRVAFGKSQDSFESSASKPQKEESPFLKHLGKILLATGVAVIAVVATKGKLWGKAEKEATSLKPSGGKPPVTEAPPASKDIIKELSPEEVQAAKKAEKKQEQPSRIAQNYRARALKAYDKSDFTSAMGLLSKALKYTPEDAELLCRRGFLHEKLGSREKALVDYKDAIAKEPYYPEGYYRRAKLVENEDPAEAFLAVQKAISLAGKSAREDYTDLNNSLYEKLGISFEKATSATQNKVKKEDLEKIISAVTNKISQTNNRSERFDLHSQRGVLREKIGDTKGAFSDYSVAITLDDSQSMPYVKRGLLHKKNNQPGKAMADYNKAISKNPKNHFAHFNKSVLLMEQDVKNVKTAIASVSEAITLKVDEPDYYSWRAKLHEQAGDSNSAELDRKVYENLVGSKK